MGCSNFCTSFNLNDMKGTIAGYRMSGLQARLGDYVPLADQMREHRQQEKGREMYQVMTSAATAGADPIQGTIEHQLADPTTSAVIAGAIIGTAVLEALTNMLAGKRASEM